MKPKKTKQKEIKMLKEIAIKLFNKGKGLTTREIGDKIGRSHAWVALVVKEKKLST